VSEFLGWFVNQPLRIAAIGFAFLLAWLALRSLSG
jgi:hypothetical protein